MFAWVVIALLTLVSALFTKADLTVAQYVRLFAAGSLMVLPFCALGLAVGESLPLHGDCYAHQRASWKMIPTVCRMPERTRLTPWRRFTR